MSASSDATGSCWRASLLIRADHPALAGHFPGDPIVPGVLLLDEVLHLLTAGLGHWRVEMVKFHQVVRPEEPLQLEARRHEGGTYTFELRSAQQLAVSGLLLRQPPSPT